VDKKRWVGGQKMAKLVISGMFKAKFKKQFLLKVGRLVQYFSKKKKLERFDQFYTLKNDFEN
jgi:hypothetical protein